jgi:hypothetical protein
MAFLNALPEGFPIALPHIITEHVYYVADSKCPLPEGMVRGLGLELDIRNGSISQGNHPSGT